MNGELLSLSLSSSPSLLINHLLIIPQLLHSQLMSMITIRTDTEILEPVSLINN